ncbi:MAG: PrsW family intramembrane metalloprotease, partial [Anaerolineaceae bacterium]|nr:PrsW family intramembrane metalloprotease [Anaerolineaceae bacterium]
MFYYLLTPILTYNYILIAAAVIPALFLMIKVYQADHLEPESPQLLYTLMRAGILSSLLALVEERVFVYLLDQCVEPNTVKYNVILYFCIVAIAEESSKYIFLRNNSWNNREFNCLYDGVVYAV